MNTWEIFPLFGWSLQITFFCLYPKIPNYHLQTYLLHPIYPQSHFLHYMGYRMSSMFILQNRDNKSEKTHTAYFYRCSAYWTSVKPWNPLQHHPFILQKLKWNLKEAVTSKIIYLYHGLYWCKNKIKLQIWEIITYNLAIRMLFFKISVVNTL